jgi:hypothetical protein
VSTTGQTFEFGLSFLGVNETTHNYRVAFVAIPSSPVANATMDDMGGGFYLPSGLSIGNFEMGNSGLPATEWSSQTMGSDNNGDAYFVSRVEAGEHNVNLNGSGPFQLVLFDIIADSNPTTGSVTFVENGNPIFNPIFIQNYINVNLGSGPVDAYLQNDLLANSLDFSALSLSNEAYLGDLSLYPNPTNEFVFIKGNVHILKSLEIYTMTGKRLMQIENDFDNIDIHSFESGIYFVKIYSNNASKIIKLIKN